MFKQWEIWSYDQVISRMSSDPQQPLDPSGKTRMYVVVCPQSHLDTGGHPVCMPIGTKQQSPLTDSELKANEGGVHHDCWVWGTEIYTLDRRHFKQKIGIVPRHVINDIQDGIRSFFDLQ